MFTSAGGWTAAADCAWECDADFDLVADACIDEQTVPCAAIQPPDNAHQVDVDVTIAFTTLNGWGEPADCAWECDGGYLSSDGTECDLCDAALGYWDFEGPGVCSLSHWVAEGLVVGPGDYPELVSDDAGGAIVVWERTANPNTDIYAQRIAADGAVADGWPPDGVPVCSADTRYKRGPAAARDGDGGVIVAWQDSRDDTPGIYAHHVLADGTLHPAWPAEGLLLYASEDLWTSEDAQLTPDGAGGAFVVWETRIGNNSASILLRRVSGDGSFPAGWDEGAVSLTAEVAAHADPHLVSDGAGGALVTWTAAAGGFSVGHVAQRITAGGAVADGWPQEWRGVGTAGWSDRAPVSDGAGGLLTAWTVSQPGAGYDVRAQHLGPSGLPLWPHEADAGGTTVAGAAYHELWGVIASDDAGGALVAWEDGRAAPDPTRDTDKGLVVGHLLPAGGHDPDWPAGGLEVATSGAGFHNEPRILADGAGGAHVVWRSHGGPNDLNGTFRATRVTAAGDFAPGWAVEGLSLSGETGAAGAYGTPRIAPDGAGGILATFVSGSNGFEVRLQRVFGDGAIPLGP